MKSSDEQIRKAMEEGHFDDLKGKGKPLNLDDNPYENPAWRLAHHMLKDGGFSLPWIEKRQGIETDLQAGREALQRAWSNRQRLLEDKTLPYDQVEAEWRRARQAFREIISSLNKRIRDYNLEAPSARFQLPIVNPDREIEAAKNNPARTDKER